MWNKASDLKRVIASCRMSIPGGPVWVAAVLLPLALTTGCGSEQPGAPTLSWYVFDERSGAFAEAAQRCSRASGGAYQVRMVPLPSDADQQREQLVRRLAAGDSTIDLIGMDVIWTPEFAAAGWILPWPDDAAGLAKTGRLAAAVRSASHQGRLWAIPFTTNAQLLWYRTDRVGQPPATWDEMLALAEDLGEQGTIQAQGERYEGLTVFFVSLLASAGSAVLNETADAVALDDGPTLAALRVMRRLATSSASDPALATSREDETRRAFESGDSSFMLNYTYVWASASRNRPELARSMGWARWPAVSPDRRSRVTVGGINVGVAAFSQYPRLALEAAACIASEENQRLAVSRGGMPPTTAALFDEPGVREVFPFADLLRETLEDAVQRPRTPLYNDVSLAISRTLHPLAGIREEHHLQRLRSALGRALRSEGLL